MDAVTLRVVGLALTAVLLLAVGRRYAALKSPLPTTVWVLLVVGGLGLLLATIGKVLAHELV